VPTPSANSESRQRRRSYAVYDKASGKVVHLVHVEVMDGAVEPAPDQIEKEVLTSGSRISGMSEDELDILSVADGQLKPRSSYSVDLESRSFRATPIQVPRTGGP
jgi:hypothetical protein